MYLSIILASFFALTAYAIPLSTRAPTDLACSGRGDCYRIYSLNASVPTGAPGSDNHVQLTFTLQDDSEKAHNWTVCSTSWVAGTTGWPQSYIKCDDDWFQWNFSKFDSITQWTMAAAHDFRMGGWGARSFANGTAVAVDFNCQTDASGTQRCSLKRGHVINLLIYGVIA